MYTVLVNMVVFILTVAIFIYYRFVKQSLIFLYFNRIVENDPIPAISSNNSAIRNVIDEDSSISRINLFDSNVIRQNNRDSNGRVNVDDATVSSLNDR